MEVRESWNSWFSLSCEILYNITYIRCRRGHNRIV